MKRSLFVAAAALVGLIAGIGAIGFSSAPVANAEQYSVECGSDGNWVIRGLSMYYQPTMKIPCTQAKPGWNFDVESDEIGDTRWLYSTDKQRVVTCDTSSGPPPGSSVQTACRLQGGRVTLSSDARPVNNAGTILYSADANNRVVVNNGNHCHREWRDGNNWRRTTLYGLGTDLGSEACRRAAWDAHYRSRSQDTPATLPAGLPPNAKVAPAPVRAAFTWSPDNNNRAVRDTSQDGVCYAEQLIDGAWWRFGTYVSFTGDYLESCRKASWNAYRKSQNAGVHIRMFPDGWPPDGAAEPPESASHED